MSLLTACQNKPYAYFDEQPINPLCYKLEYFTLQPDESMYILNNGNRFELEAMEVTRTTIREDCRLTTKLKHHNRPVGK